MTPSAVACIATLLFATTLPSVASASFPYKYDWSRFPAAWFGANSTSFESDEQLELIGKYSLAIFGWQHMINATNWTASVYAQLEQAALLKARFPSLPVYSYAGFGNANGYNANVWPLIKSASDGCPGHQPCRKIAEPYADWFLQTDTVPVYSMSACEQMGLGYSNPPTDRCWNPIWNVANLSAREFFVDKIITPLAIAPMIDGVFFDCFNFAYGMPSPWNRRATNIPDCVPGQGGAGCEALLNGTIDLARAIAIKLNTHQKLPMFSNPASFANPNPGKPFWLNESRLIEALDGLDYQFNYEFMRAENLASSGQRDNMLEESQLGVSAGVHTYLKNQSEDVTPHAAAFLLFRQTGWFFFGSTGWLDGDWKWEEAYDKLSVCGKPKGLAAYDSSGVLRRPFEGCSVWLNCTGSGKQSSCVAGVKY